MVTLGTADPNTRDLELIRRLAAVGAKAGLSSVAGLDVDNGGEMSVLAFFVTGREAIRRQDTEFEELHDVRTAHFAFFFGGDISLFLLMNSTIIHRFHDES